MLKDKSIIFFNTFDLKFQKTIHKFYLYLRGPYLKNSIFKLLAIKVIHLASIKLIL